ncbi:MAG: aminoacetone oxidase family FAD-binding enzyme [Ruminiclostridium sp.]|nr:aminoacetone oxidase family FAD-binding enzyme [Ruminiclostridium sp.]
MKKYDIIIIGGGASGLAAAIAVKKYSDFTVAILEKGQRAGKKILSTGNGRCNLTNCRIDNDCYNGERTLLGRLSSDIESTEEFFSEMGLACKKDDQGRVYPYSMAASSVLDALRFTATAKGVDILCEHNVSEIRKTKSGYEAVCGAEIIKAGSVIIAAGGCATPSLGSDGSGYVLAKKLGHSKTNLYPALAPIRTDINLVKALKGLRTYAKASLSSEGRILAEQTGEVQFSDGALSGICIFNVSSIAARYVGKAEIILDIAPDFKKKDISYMLFTTKETRSSLPCEELLTGLFHKRIGQSVLKNASISLNKTCGELTEKEIYRICDVIKEWRFPVTAVSDWSLAQVTSGGIKTEEINEKLESIFAKGVFFCGEILDIDGICGGYNLDFAWKSGYTAGKNSAEYIYDIKG